MLNQVVAVLLGTVLLLPLVTKAGVLNMFRSKPYPEVFFGSTRLCVECLKSSHSRGKSSHTSGIHEQSLK